jgi:hypothetical protein
MGQIPSSGLNPEGDVIPNLSALTGALAFRVREEVRYLSAFRIALRHPHLDVFLECTHQCNYVSSLMYCKSS